MILFKFWFGFVVLFALVVFGCLLVCSLCELASLGIDFELLFVIWVLRGNVFCFWLTCFLKRIWFRLRFLLGWFVSVVLLVYL